MSQRNANGAATSTPAELFGRLVRKMRNLAELSQLDLAHAIPCDRSQVAKIESGKRVPHLDTVRRMDEVLKTGGVLEDMFQQVDFYVPPEFPDWFRRRAELDEELSELYEYQTTFLPGLLQTQEYARALVAQYAAQHETQDQIESKVAGRLSRQERFLMPDGPLYVALLDESCIRNEFGGTDVMIGQLEHLLTVGSQPNVRVLVLPFEHRRVTPPSTSMSLITLPDGEQWVYSESLERGHLSNETGAIRSHRRAYDLLRADSLSAHESAALIRDAVRGHHHDQHHQPEHRELAQEQLQRGERRQLHRVRPGIRPYRRRPRPRQQEP